MFFYSANNQPAKFISFCEFYIFHSLISLRKLLYFAAAGPSTKVSEKLILQVLLFITRDSAAYTFFSKRYFSEFF